MKTRDLFHASILKMKGLKITGISWEGKNGFWEFADPEGVADMLINQFINGDLEGNIKEFVEAHGTVKGMLYK